MKSTHVIFRRGNVVLPKNIESKVEDGDEFSSRLKTVITNTKVFWVFVHPYFRNCIIKEIQHEKLSKTRKSQRDERKEKIASK